MKRREDEVSGETGVYRDIRRFVVADFADQYHVRVLSDDGAESHGEGVVSTSRYLCLRDIRDLVFHGIFDRDDFRFRCIEFAKDCVECRRLAAAGRAGIEYDAGRLLERPLDLFIGESAKSQDGNILERGFLIEETHHETFAEISRDARHANIYLSRIECE